MDTELICLLVPVIPLLVCVGIALGIRGEGRRGQASDNSQFSYDQPRTSTRGTQRLPIRRRGNPGVMFDDFRSMGRDPQSWHYRNEFPNADAAVKQWRKDIYRRAERGDEWASDYLERREEYYSHPENLE